MDDQIALLEVARVALSHGLSEAQAQELDLSDAELNRLALVVTGVLNQDKPINLTIGEPEKFPYDVQIPKASGDSTWRSKVMLTSAEATKLTSRLADLEVDGKIKHEWFVYSEHSIYTLKDVNEYLKFD